MVARNGGRLPRSFLPAAPRKRHAEDDEDHSQQASRADASLPTPYRSPDELHAKIGVLPSSESVVGFYLTGHAEEPVLWDEAHILLLFTLIYTEQSDPAIARLATMFSRSPRGCRLQRLRRGSRILGLDQEAEGVSQERRPGQDVICKWLDRSQGLQNALNPYVGCAHNCVYYYASFMARFSCDRPWANGGCINAPGR